MNFFRNNPEIDDQVAVVSDNDRFLRIRSYRNPYERSMIFYSCGENPLADHSLISKDCF